MSLIKLNLNKEQSVKSVSATKPQLANAAILFGKNAAVIIKRLEELVKIKELDTSKLSALLDVLKDEDATQSLAKKAAGKTLVTAVRNLYKAKTLVATINALRAIKIKPAAGNAVAATTKRGAAKQLSAVDQSAIGDVTAASLRKMTHAQRVAFTNKLVHILGLEKLTYGIDNRGESFKSKPGDEWEMDGHVGQLSVHLTFDDPYNGTSKGKWILSLNTGVDDKSFAFNDFEGIKAAINKNHGKTPVASATNVNVHSMVEFGNLFDEDDGDDVLAGKRIAKFSGLKKIPPRAIGGMGDNGSGDSFYFYTSSPDGPNTAIIFGESADMKFSYKDIMGKGKFTVASVKFGEHIEEVVHGHPDNRKAKQLGTFNDFDKAFAAFVAAVKGTAK